jgi:5'-deoxynucleotidase YfbR-like HD superfamily hydrolase
MKHNPWIATLTQRWHTNTHFRKTGDDVGGHSARVTILMLHLKPDVSRKAIIAAITHDLGEKATADVSYVFKKAEPEVAEVIKVYEEKAIEQMGFDVKGLTLNEKKLIKLCDWLDSYLWAYLHNPLFVSKNLSWANQLESMFEQAMKLDLYEEVSEIVSSHIKEVGG